MVLRAKADSLDVETLALSLFSADREPKSARTDGLATKKFYALINNVFLLSI
jgi:hypothetical protein